jgi:RNase H-fold protein (predicted Holliday junction resolvase)
MLAQKTVLAVDPGFKKNGLALVRREATGSTTLLWRRIATREEVAEAITEAAAISPYEIMVVGNGTRSKETVDLLRAEFPSASILLVDETNTSQAAREKYWEHHPRPWWRRLLPSSLQVPPVEIDDFAALVLAERVLNE